MQLLGSRLLSATKIVWLGLLSLLLTAYTVSPQPVPVEITETTLATLATCSGAFVAHDLDHITTTADGMIRQFQANGAGLAINDLNNDGKLDLVLGSENGPNTILWDEGNLNFRKTTFGQGPTRAVTAVDVDADGWIDLILTRNIGVLNYWHNQGDGTFAQEILPGIVKLAYNLNWGDLDGDGDLDLVTASYDAGFLSAVGTNYLLQHKGGVVYYENQNGKFKPTILASQAQGLALGLFDVNNDNRPDILVGNDFAVPDQAWVRTNDGWTAATPFANTTHSTMSLEQGDINNDGAPEFFASDMLPYPGEAMEPWEPMMMDMMDEPPQTYDPKLYDPQIMENVLQFQEPQGRYFNLADAWGINGTGWSWSAQFGDLDNDGYVDLYVVNGMIEEKIFSYLPKNELVEENQVFHNDTGLHFTAMPQWQLNSTRSGRSMVMADLDQDGDLDIVVNNLRSAAQLFENRLCGGDSLEVELNWPQVQNHQAIGARLFLHTSTGTYMRDVRAVSGYLSTNAPRVHFGFPMDATLESLEIHWPDGQVSLISGLAKNKVLHVAR